MPLIPLHDANPRLYIRAHFVTIGLVIANFAIFLAMLGMSEAESFDAVIGYAVIPARMFEGATLAPGVESVSPLLSLVTYQFLHGGWAHVIFNMLFLWVFGDNIEDAMGHARFLLFFLVCGAMGALVHGLIDTTSPIPVIGASGSISGVLGAYLMLYPRARLLVLLFVFIPLRLPAIMVIGTFFAQDLLWAATNSPAALGTAVWAHIGGFITGAFLVIFMRNPWVSLWQKPAKP
jgi:membrane associated rhomboid family serine protease